MTCSLQGNRTPLDVAIENVHTTIVTILITHGANVDTERKDWVRNL